MAWYRCLGSGGGGGSATLITKTIIQNGIYNAFDDNADGYSQVTVSTSGGAEYLIDANDFIAGTYIKDTNGAEASATGWSATDFIPVTAGETLNTAINSNDKYNCWYDSSKTFISNFRFDTGYSTITPPTGAAYFRASNTDANMGKFMVWRDATEVGRLCYVEYVMNDRVEIPTIDSLDTGSNYSNYLSYDNTTKKFTVLQNFTAIITAWVEQANNASSKAKGEFYINNTSVLGTFETPSTNAGSKSGATKIFDLVQGDTFYSYTPSTNGWPQQHLKVYITTLPNGEDMCSFTDEDSTT